MANGFNHAEAERSFREAIRQDSTFAMGYWGIAYVLGPNYNSGGENMGAIKDIKNAVKRPCNSVSILPRGKWLLSRPYRLNFRQMHWQQMMQVIQVR